MSGGRKSFLQLVPKEDVSTVTMRKHKQVCSTHLALTEGVFFIELIEITDLDLVLEVRVKNDDGDIEVRMMSIRSILMEIKVEVLKSKKPLFLMISIRPYQGWIEPTASSWYLVQVFHLHEENPRREANHQS